MHVKALENRGVEKKTRRQVSFETDVHEAEDQNQDDLFTLGHQLVDEHAEDVCVNDRCDSVDELREVDQARVRVVPDLRNVVIEKVRHDCERTARDQRHSAFLSVCDLQNGA